jgi:hypothetical protein
VYFSNCTTTKILAGRGLGVPSPVTAALGLIRPEPAPAPLQPGTLNTNPVIPSGFSFFPTHHLLRNLFHPLPRLRSRHALIQSSESFPPHDELCALRLAAGDGVEAALVGFEGDAAGGGVHESKLRAKKKDGNLAALLSLLWNFSYIDFFNVKPAKPSSPTPSIVKLEGSGVLVASGVTTTTVDSLTTT